ncbi:MAG: aconitase family protein [Aquificota bacterium]|nr:aconitase family protein [Aquificota bacterium]
MVNCLGVLGWELEELRQRQSCSESPYYIPVPEVVGVRLKGKPKNTVFATDIVLTITNILRKKGVVGKFVEFFGEGVKNLSLPDRATISNMAPEYGARCGFFPPDEQTIKYLRLTGRPRKHIELVRWYLLENFMFQEYDEEPRV